MKPRRTTKVSIGFKTSDLVKEKLSKETRQQILTKVVLACEKSPDYSTIIFDPETPGGVNREEDEGKTVVIGMPGLPSKVYATRVHYDTVEDLQKALDVGAEGQDQVTILLEEEY